MDGLASDEQRSDDADGHFFMNRQTIWKYIKFWRSVGGPVKIYE